ncbi:hypothetical protein CNMCM5793_001996 [Aspergillus hiratsukae]|uniref:DUF967 domain protein n=1 Tax=Aspergillus hiratsukae TaxID=1194566 RepID=A0A8H6PCM8_9EURO|nr:hypothetical protein CNMCM5793_001996 [Aspergillus hiratsukae]
MDERSLRPVSTDPTVLAAEEASPSLHFRSFTSETAWALGHALRSRILSLPSAKRKPALVSIALVGTGTQPQVVFQCTTEPGVIPDNEAWVRRKRNTVLRWGVSSFLMRNRMLTMFGVGPNELQEAFIKRFAVENASYVLSGGGFPIRLRGVEGLVGVIAVSGLQMEDDHQVIVETVEEFIQHN